MGRGLHRKRLGERDPQREAGLRIVGKALPVAPSIKRVEIDQAAQGLGGDRMGEGAVVGRDPGRGGAVERASSGRPLRSTASSSRIAARRDSVPALSDLLDCASLTGDMWSGRTRLNRKLSHDRQASRPFEAARLSLEKPARAGAGPEVWRTSRRPEGSGADPLRRLGEQGHLLGF
jgi:hypothetical protein